MKRPRAAGQGREESCQRGGRDKAQLIADYPRAWLVQSDCKSQTKAQQRFISEHSGLVVQYNSHIQRSAREAKGAEWRVWGMSNLIWKKWFQLLMSLLMSTFLPSSRTLIWSCILPYSNKEQKFFRNTCVHTHTHQIEKESCLISWQSTGLWWLRAYFSNY